jgi:hypothetical protein
MGIARATISRHVSPNVNICGPRMLHWNDNFECLIMAFSGHLHWFFYFFRRRSSGSLVFLSMMIGGDANNEEVDGLLIISFIP